MSAGPGANKSIMGRYVGKCNEYRWKNYNERGWKRDKMEKIQLHMEKTKPMMMMITCKICG